MSSRDAILGVGVTALWLLCLGVLVAGCAFGLVAGSGSMAIDRSGHVRPAADVAAPVSAAPPAPKQLATVLPDGRVQVASGLTLDEKRELLGKLEAQHLPIPPELAALRPMPDAGVKDARHDR